jgi:hypothetical protein
VRQFGVDLDITETAGEVDRHRPERANPHIDIITDLAKGLTT